MKFILGKKIEMTQVYNQAGEVIPATRILAGPCFVSQIKTLEKDKYCSVQLGFLEKKKINKPQKGHLKGLKKNFKYLKEFRIDEPKGYKKGDEIKVSIFEDGDLVNVIGISKGKGFQGVVKRHHFKGAFATHGTKDQLRMPGSIGAVYPQRVLKGKRMAGRMGYERLTVKNLEVIEIDDKKHEILLKGAVPGPRNNLLMLISIGKKARKTDERRAKKDKKEAKEKTKKEKDKG